MWVEKSSSLYCICMFHKVFLPFIVFVYLLQISWSPWVGAPSAVDLDLETVAIISSRVTQPLEGAGSKVLYLAKGFLVS